MLTAHIVVGMERSKIKSAFAVIYEPTLEDVSNFFEGLVGII